MAQTQDDSQPFTGFGVLNLSKPEDGVFLLVVFRDGALTAAAYATERGAMAAALEAMDDERSDDDDDLGGPLEERYARIYERIADEGGVMEIIPSPVYGS